MGHLIFTTCLEEEFEIEYSVNGKHIPATRLDPAEYPEIEITSVKVFGVEVMQGMPQKTLDKLQQEVEENHEDDHSYDDYLYEQAKDKKLWDNL